MDRLINILVTITLVELMVAIGLGTTFSDAIGVLRNRRLVAQAALANYVSDHCNGVACPGLGPTGAGDTWKLTFITKGDFDG